MCIKPDENSYLNVPPCALLKTFKPLFANYKVESPENGVYKVEQIQ